MRKGFKKSCNKGFTLAEVLITLGIIGVVASMTLPALIQRNNERQTVVKLKKVYSLLQQAQLNIINDYGIFDNLVTSNTSTGETDENGSNIYDLVFTVIKFYLKVQPRENLLIRTAAGTVGAEGAPHGLF